MATREKRLAQFDGNGEPPPHELVEVLCEDHSGTYQLPFRCQLGGRPMAQQFDRRRSRSDRYRLAAASPENNGRGLIRRARCFKMQRNGFGTLTYGTWMERTASESVI